MSDTGAKILDIRKYGKKHRGRGELITHLTGRPLSDRERIWAHCYDCMNYCHDTDDCKQADCPLYPVWAEVVRKMNFSGTTPIKSSSVCQSKDNLETRKMDRCWDGLEGGRGKDCEGWSHGGDAPILS